MAVGQKFIGDFWRTDGYVVSGGAENRVGTRIYNAARCVKFVMPNADLMSSESYSMAPENDVYRISSRE